MADRWAVASTAWSLLSTWNGGASLPASGDDVYANGFTVPIDQDITVNTLRNAAGSGIAAGGGFTIANPSGRVVTISGSGSINAGGLTNSSLIAITGTGTLTINGNVSGGTSILRQGINLSGNVTVTVNGTLAGGAGGGGAHGLNSTGTSAQVILTGTALGGTNGGSGVAQSGASARLTCTGTVQGGTAGTSPGVTVTGGAARFDALLVYGASGPPVSSTVAIQLVRGGASLGMQAASDDDWPASTGAPIVLAEGSGGDPKRFLNVGGVAVPIQ